MESLNQLRYISTGYDKKTDPASQILQPVSVWQTGQHFHFEQHHGSCGGVLFPWFHPGLQIFHPAGCFLLFQYWIFLIGYSIFYILSSLPLCVEQPVHVVRVSLSRGAAPSSLYPYGVFSHYHINKSTHHHIFSLDCHIHRQTKNDTTD